MKSRSISMFLLLLLSPVFCLFPQDSGSMYNDEIPIPEIDLVVGPRVGLTGIIMDFEQFNTEMQVGFPRDVDYIPIFTEFGFSAKQVVGMGDSGRNLIIEELVLLAGLDQSFAIPAIRFLLGIEGRLGSEIKVGPYLVFTDNSGKVGIQASFVYSLGWTISSRGMIIPIDISFVPQPSYWQPRITITTGLSFRVPE
ncbi:MAG: hypothetical protein JW852_01685 [Spirochaetales bacterium]|nr:hypothetical protein [Spirochaetales bacterium]